MLPDRIELSTSPLPRECSTTELRQQRGRAGICGPSESAGIAKPGAHDNAWRLWLRFALFDPARDGAGKAGADGQDQQETGGLHRHDEGQVDHR